MAKRVKIFLLVVFGLLMGIIAAGFLFRDKEGRSALFDSPLFIRCLGILIVLFGVSQLITNRSLNQEDPPHIRTNFWGWRLSWRGIQFVGFVYILLGLLLLLFPMRLLGG